MKRILSASLAVAMVALSGVFVACGGGITDTESPVLGVVGDSNEVVLRFMGPRDRDRTLENIEIENVGPGTLRVNNIEWIAKPERLHGYHQGENSTEGGVCSNDGDCGADAFCITASGTCRDLGFRSTPIELESGRRLALNLVILASSQPMQCPEPHAGVPEGVRRNYCGELLIETNATNDGSGIEDGNTRFYFITDGSSGLMALSETFLRFTDVVPGGSYTRTFSINNEDGQPLTVERVSFSENPSWFSISPFISHTEIAGNGSMAFTLELNVPADAEMEDLEFGTNVNFESSSTGTTPSMHVDVTAGPGPVPIIEVTPMQLSFFAESSRDLEIRNHGGGTLAITGLNVTPAEVAEYYQVFYNGEEILHGAGSISNLGPAQGGEATVRELTVVFDGPGDGSSTLGSLNINHSDTRSARPVRVQLLGDNETVAIGEVGYHESFRDLRLISDGGAQERRLPLFNRGNAPLTIDSLELTPSGSTEVGDYTIKLYEDGNYVDLDGVTLAPGEIRELVITYAGTSQFTQNLVVDILSNHAGQQALMRVAISGNTGSASQLEASLVPSFSTTALVGQPTSFQISLSGSGEGTNTLNHAQWMTLKRPEGSEAVLQTEGPNASFVPDVAGTYRVLAQVRDSDNRVVQSAPLEFVATE